jgi:mono/diheme cytochrome c family protein
MHTPYATRAALVRLPQMHRVSIVAALFAIAIALLATGCLSGTETTATADTVVGTLPESTTGGGDAAELKGDPVAGKMIFADKGCGGCHTLADAGSTGNVGPNLDETKPPTELVVKRVTEGMAPMPSFADSLSAQQIADVAAYVVQSTSG